LLKERPPFSRHCRSFVLGRVYGIGATIVAVVPVISMMGRSSVGEKVLVGQCCIGSLVGRRELLNQPGIEVCQYEGNFDLVPQSSHTRIGILHQHGFGIKSLVVCIPVLPVPTVTRFRPSPTPPYCTWEGCAVGWPIEIRASSSSPSPRTSSSWQGNIVEPRHRLLRLHRVMEALGKESEYSLLWPSYLTAVPDVLGASF
jgi:hypothetical protein